MNFKTVLRQALDYKNTQNHRLTSDSKKGRQLLAQSSRDIVSNSARPIKKTGRGS